MIKNNKTLIIKLISILLMLVIPFSNSDYSDNIQPEKSLLI